MNRQSQRTVSLGRRTIACLLALVMVLGLVPAALPQAAAVSVNDAMQKVVDWGFMRGDINGNLRPNDPITRAEFVTIVNRAFGYHVMGKAPFTDVKDADWYAQDVSIAYTENYITGTTATTFSPKGKLTREQAVVILARNMRLQAYPGEDTSFSDSRDLQEWSRGLVEQAVRHHLVSGYPDGTFRPKRAITRGEAAVLLVNAVGNPVQEKGVHTLDGVYGNVTITASGVTLRDTVVAGNLYITDGVDLGSILLENVRVLGQIVVCGGGVSEDGDDSIVLRNVDAQELIIDTQRGQEISLRVEGDGTIQKATVRTNSFLKDNTGDSVGIREIVLDGGKDAKLSLAGNLKKVVNKTPGSTINLVSGTAASITVDEAATGSTLNLEAGTLADEVNLDVGTTVTGKGDIGKLTVNAPGSTVTMLPDQIIIRPGLNATINGTVMDSNAAAEASADPRLMGGYPSVTDLAPTSAQVKFRGNKAGTVYWAVTPITAGSVGAGDLINPPSYSTEILKHGTASLSGSAAENTTKLTGLTSGGSYYLSAVFVDARETQSPVKVISFSTPDNTVPNFASGYPYLSKIENISAQVTVMATKTCQLYYALLPKGATAPKPDDFKAGAGAVPGNLGFGTLAVTKNTTYPFDVNNVPLEELESYDLYLWLTDREGGVSSAVKKLSFTTVDRTPPRFNVEATVNKLQATSVGLYANLNEKGTLYWAVVPEGETYPKPLAGSDPSSTVDLSSDNAKLQVVSGMNAFKNGKVSMTENKDVNFTVSGLEKEKSYDLYYVAQDTAGNYSDTVKKLTIHTLDQSAPEVTQEFTRFNSGDPTHPLPDTDIRIVFSEPVMDIESLQRYTDLYQAVLDAEDAGEKEVARNQLATILRTNFTLYEMVNNIEEPVVDRSVDHSASDWTIDYRYAKVTIEEGKMVVTLPTEDDPKTSALNLKSGATYFFKIENIADTSSNQNPMGVVRLDKFTTVFAQVNLSAAGNSTETITDNGQTYPVDAYWRLNPVSTQNVAESIKWDTIIWSDTTVSFTLWRRESQDGGSWTAWEKVTGPNADPNTQITADPTAGQFSGISMTMNKGLLNQTTFNPLRELKEGTTYEYAASFNMVRGDSDRNNWSGTVNMNINVVAGETNALKGLASNVTEENWEAMVEKGTDITNIGRPTTLNLHVPFQDKTPPVFINGYPEFTAGDSAVNMDLMLSRKGTVYYVLAPMGDISTKGSKVSDPGTELNYGNEVNWETLPESGIDANELVTATMPDYNSIVNAKDTYANSKNVKYGSLAGGQSVSVETVEGLLPKTKYIAYFVTRGTAQVYSEVSCYRFETGDVETPYITLQENSPKVKFTTSEDAEVDYVLFASNKLPSIFTRTLTQNDMVGDNDKDKEEKWKELQGADSQANTVLKLMLKTRNDGYSWLDYYGSDALKKEVSEYILRTSSGNGSPAGQGTMTTKENESKSVDFTANMNDISATKYYCLATARNILGGKYSFKAVSDVHVPDTTPPVLTHIGGSITGSSGTGLGMRYHGTLTLTFDDLLYWVNNDGDAETITPVHNAAADGKKYKSLIQHLGGSRDKFTSVGTSTGPTSTFNLQYRDVYVGETITLFSDGYVCNSSGYSTKNRITLEFAVTGTGVNGALIHGWKPVTQKPVSQ